MIIRAVILDEKGRPSKVVLPPRTTREIEVTNKTDSILFTTREQALKSILVVNTLSYGNKILLYNGGLETQWIEHGDIVAE